MSYSTQEMSEIRVSSKVDRTALTEKLSKAPSSKLTSTPWSIMSNKCTPPIRKFPFLSHFFKLMGMQGKLFLLPLYLQPFMLHLHRNQYRRIAYFPFFLCLTLVTRRKTSFSLSLPSTKLTISLFHLQAIFSLATPKVFIFSVRTILQETKINISQ